MKLNFLLSLLVVLTLSIMVFAQVPPSPSPSPAPTAHALASPALSPAPTTQNASADFISQVFQTVKNWGGMSTLLKIMAAITLIVSSMKVSFVNQYFWSKLGAGQIWVAPALGLLGGVLNLGVSGPVTLASVFAYACAGGGAVYLHEILDKVKLIPGLGPVWVGLIDTIESKLGGPASQNKAA